MQKTTARLLQPATRFFMIILLSLLAVGVHSADKKLITDDGREVLLKDDGSWAFRSTDRFANTDDGRRVRLKPDGSWHYIKNTPIVSPAKSQAPSPVIKLEKVVIEKYERKALKNTRVKTRTVFYLKIEKTPPEKLAPGIKDSDISRIEVTDNNGKNYPVTAIKPGASGSIAVYSEKSPSILDDAKSMEITLKAEIFGLKKPLTLTERISDFDEINVESFE